jgi:molybdopterin adenylyltransferase
MPKEGIFARVIRGGVLKPEDELLYQPKVFSFLVITLSDRASRGEYEDKSGPAIVEILESHYRDGKRQIVIMQNLIPDDSMDLLNLLKKAREEMINFVITTGGTGIGPRDITVETVRPLLDKEIPGIMERIRVKYGEEKPNALLSRGVSGLMGSTFVYTLPGSVKGVKEYMTEILKTNDHLVYMLNGLDAH